MNIHFVIKITFFLVTHFNYWKIGNDVLVVIVVVAVTISHRALSTSSLEQLCLPLKCYLLRSLFDKCYVLTI